MQGNNILVGFALLIVVAICAAFMPWGAVNVAVGTPQVDGEALSVTVTAFSGSIRLPWLIVPHWLATLLIFCGAVLGMTNAKGITTFSRGIVLTPLLIVAAHCLLIAVILTHEVTPSSVMKDADRAFQVQQHASDLGAGLVVTLLAAVCGLVVSMPLPRGRSRIWITLTCYHLAAASCLVFMIGAAWEEVIRGEYDAGSPTSGLAAVFPIVLLLAVIIEVIACGLHRRKRWAWFASAVFSLLCCFPIFSLVASLDSPIIYLLGCLAVVCLYWGLLAPGTLAEFQPIRARGTKKEE